MKGILKNLTSKSLSIIMAVDGINVNKIAHYLNVSAQMIQKWIDESMSDVN